MLKGRDFGAAIGVAIQKKIDARAVKSKADIARHFGMKPPSLSDWVKKGSVAKDKLPELWRYFSDVVGAEHWGMSDDEWPLGLSDGAIPPVDACCAYPDSVETVVVPIMDAGASMGFGVPQLDYETVVDNMRLTREWVRSNLPSITAPKNLAVLSAYGDSMAPTFSDGDIVLVDRGITEIKMDAVYVLALNDELYVKRIQRRITDGAVLVLSDNPAYQPVVVDNGERSGLRVLGRVVWAWNGRKL